jgi:hypothetical protein
MRKIKYLFLPDNAVTITCDTCDMKHVKTVTKHYMSILLSAGHDIYAESYPGYNRGPCEVFIRVKPDWSLEGRESRLALRQACRMARYEVIPPDEVDCPRCDGLGVLGELYQSGYFYDHGSPRLCPMCEGKKLIKLEPVVGSFWCGVM